MKSRIPMTIKRKNFITIWGHREVAPCYCCGVTEITLTQHSSGHILSEHEGGQITIDNLRPICNSCNSSMGTQHMWKFMVDNNLEPPKFDHDYENYKVMHGIYFRPMELCIMSKDGIWV